jgi:hypothetical protein
MNPYRMFFKHEKKGKHLSERIKPIFAAVLLFLYVLGNVQVESFHQAFHSLEKALHSTEQEKDPCHRAIYHEVTNEGCDHKTHLSAPKKCPLCHVVPFNEQHLAVINSAEPAFLPDEFGQQIIPVEIYGSILQLPSRAPPFH